MNVFGVPLHPLVVHAAVVITPLAVLTVMAFALLPSLRWLTRWPALLLTLAAAGSVTVAKLSGQALRDDRFKAAAGTALGDKIAAHQDLANSLFLVLLVFTALVVVAVWVLGGPTGLASGRGTREGRGSARLSMAVSGGLLVVGAAVLVLVTLAGDAGARAVWER